MIRNILYLDVDKLHSMSSQAFEGVTEYILNERAKGSEQATEQKGPVGSGRILGDILLQHEKVSEKRFLIDHSFALFEKKLLDEKRLTDISDCGNIGLDLSHIRANTFIRVKAKVAFNDMASIKETVANFNKVGHALANVTNHAELLKARSILAAAKDANLPVEQLKHLESRIKELSKLDELKKATGLYQDPKFLEDLVTMLNFGYQNLFEVQMKVGSHMFSANLKRECLREREDMLIRKYSRHTEVEFVLFGVVTQVEHAASKDVSEVPEGAKLKEAVMAMIGMLSNLEGTFTGRLNNEIIIDPLAVYTEIM